MADLFSGRYTVRRLLLCMGFGAAVIVVATIRNALRAGEAGALAESVGILAVAAAGGAAAGRCTSWRAGWSRLDGCPPTCTAW